MKIIQPGTRLVGAALTLSLLAACANTTTRAPVVDRAAPAAPAAAASAPLPSKGYYTVKKGDTLLAIALDHGQDYKDLVAWNNLENPNRILVGQQLRVSANAGPAPGEAATSNAVASTQPIAAAGVVEKRSLDGAPSAVAAPTKATELFKREPKAGKEVYSDAALAQAQSSAGTAAPPAVTKPSLVAVVEAAKPEAKPEAKAEAKSAETKPAVAGDDLAWAWPATGKVLAGYKDGANKGVDIAGKQGEPVAAAADGKVAYIGTGIASLGKLVILRHNANFLSAYAHNSTITVKEGQSVSKGQKIAEIGSTGTDVAKLHFEIRRQGTPVDPLQYLPKR
jgi:lipoprotein NlpD